MSETSADYLRFRLRALMAHHGLTVYAWAQKAGMPESTLRNFLAGRSETVTYATLVNLAKAIERPAVALFAEGTESFDPIFILHETDAIKWSDHMFADHEARFWLNLPRDPRYPGIEREGVLVGDASFDLIYPQGTILISTDYQNVHREPAHGDKVLCIEHGWSDEALLNEEAFPDLERTSVRELVCSGNQKWLLLRSTIPFERNTLTMTDPYTPAADILAPTANLVEGGWVELRGVIIGSYRLE